MGDLLNSMEGLSKIAPGVAVFVGIAGAVAMFTIGLLVRMKRASDSGLGGDDLRSVVYAINHLTYSVDHIGELLEILLERPKKPIRQRKKKPSGEVPMVTVR
jgi:hypothetical protein